MRFVKAAVATATVIGVMSVSAVAATKGTVLVVGAGKSGQPLIKILHDQGYGVRALVRDAAKAGDLGKGVIIVVGDVTKPETLPAAMKGAEYVISTIGAGIGGNTPEEVDYKGVAALADAAKAAKVKQLVLMSSIGAGDTNPETFLNKRFGMVLMFKGKGEDHLRKSGVPYTVVRPGGLQDCDPGKVGFKVAGPGDLQGSICRSDVGLLMAASLGNKDALGKTITVVSDDKAPIDAWKKELAAIKKD